MFSRTIFVVILIALAHAQDHYPPVPYNEACVTQGFHSGHQGVDIGSYGAKRVSMYTIWEGTVIGVCNGAADYNQSVCGACGNSVEIQHNTVKVLYCHMTSGSITVSVGQRVARAQRIGTMGTSGYSTGVHLHVQVREINGGQLRDIRTRLGLNGWPTC